MSTDRIAALEGLREKDPGNSLTLLMLANEYFKAGRWSDTVALLRDYLARTDDEGAAIHFGRYVLVHGWPLMRWRRREWLHAPAGRCRSGKYW